MRSKKSIGVAFCFVLVGVLSTTCSGSNAVPCTAGQSVACAGVGGCAGYQVCKADGTYDVCNCGGGQPDGGPTSSDGGPSLDGSSQGDSGTQDSGGTTDSGTGTDSGNGTDGGPWSPASFSGLSLWLDDDVGVVQDTQKPGYVRRWLDQSGNSNNASVPNYGLCEPSIDPAVLNGHDAIVMAYSSCNFEIADATTLQFGAGDFLVGAVVMVPQYGTNELYIWNKSPYRNGLYLYQDTSNSFNASIGTNKAVVADPNTAKFHIVIAQGAALTLFVDALMASALTNTTDISFPGANVDLMSGANNGVQGFEIAEIVAVKGTVSSSDVAKLQNYWKQKFKL